MKIRFKFRSDFFVYIVSSADAQLLELLEAVSQKWNIELANVQLSLNANDYFGIEQSASPLSAWGIVSGDILYVNSLEKLDDIRRSMEMESFGMLNKLFNAISLPMYTPPSIYSVLIQMCATSKGLKVVNPVSYSDDIVRLSFSYGDLPNEILTITVFCTGHLLNIAGSSEAHNIHRQLIFLARDYLSALTLVDQAVLANPAIAFKGIPNLSIEVKDKLLEPILVDLHTALELPQRPSLLTLPYEIQTQIFRYLPLNNLGKLMLTCSRMLHGIQHCAPLWRHYLSRMEAKKRPLLLAALNRQQTQQQKQQSTTATTPSNVTSDGGYNAVPATAARNAESVMEPESTDNCPDQEQQSTDLKKTYQDFLVRYRSQKSLRWRGSFSSLFI